MKSESIILPEVLVAVTDLPDTLAWRANSGVFLSLDGRRHIRANIPGCADVIGVRAGRAIAIETKTLKGDQRKTQENFQLRWELAGGLYIVARSAEDALRGLGEL
jgi:hypothetical protein